MLTLRFRATPARCRRRRRGGLPRHRAGSGPRPRTHRGHRPDQRRNVDEFARSPGTAGVPRLVSVAWRPGKSSRSGACPRDSTSAACSWHWRSVCADIERTDSCRTGAGHRARIETRTRASKPSSDNPPTSTSSPSISTSTPVRAHRARRSRSISLSKCDSRRRYCFSDFAMCIRHDRALFHESPRTPRRRATSNAVPTNSGEVASATA